MAQHYMTRDERYQLEALYKAGIPVAQIAQQLGFCRQTIYNEIRRGLYVHTCDWWDEVRYSAEKAQTITQDNQTMKGRPLKIGKDHAYANYLEDMIVHHRYSPAAALAAARKNGYQTEVCTTTLYSYIDKGIFLHLTKKHLWQKSKRRFRRQRTVQRIAHPQFPSITQRPEAINNRQEYGHWEMDLIIGKAKTRPVLLTLTERMTREEQIYKLPNRKAATIRAVFDRLEKQDPKFQDKFRSGSMFFLKFRLFI